MNAIDVKDLTFSYDGKTKAVEHLNFEVKKRGSVWFLRTKWGWKVYYNQAVDEINCSTSQYSISFGK